MKRMSEREREPKKISWSWSYRVVSCRLENAIQLHIHNVLFESQFVCVCSCSVINRRRSFVTIWCRALTQQPTSSTSTIFSSFAVVVLVVVVAIVVGCNKFPLSLNCFVVSRILPFVGSISAQQHTSLLILTKSLFIFFIKRWVCVCVPFHVFRNRQWSLLHNNQFDEKNNKTNIREDNEKKTERDKRSKWFHLILLCVYVHQVSRRAAQCSFWVDGQKVCAVDDWWKLWKLQRM